MRDKTFYINSIKMDLLRVVTVAGDVTKDLPKQSVQEFLIHADDDFKKINLSKLEKELYDELQQLCSALNKSVQDDKSRLQWAEKILTIRCRL